jgi:hypothetical protein
MNQTFRIAAAALAVGVFAAGCNRTGLLIGAATVATAGAAGGYFYAKGDLEGDLDKDLDKVYGAASRSVIEEGFNVERQELTDINAVVEARGMDRSDQKEKKITVKLRRAESGATHVSIRVGVFGDEALSRRIMQGIEKRL